MKHIVSFETAKALKAAGYPQPEFETGQAWYNWNGRATVIGPPVEGGKYYRHLFSLASGHVEQMEPIAHDSFYAPSATEIMEHERMNFCVCKYYGSALWVCSVVDESLAYVKENHAEAAAELWLKLNAK